MTPGKKINLRLVIICISAASIGLSMAIISLAKLLLMLCGLACLLWAWKRPARENVLAGMWTPVAVLLALGALTLSLGWTIVPLDDAAGSVAKYGKLLFLPMLVLLIRDRREALFALGAFALAQAFLVLSSWLLFAGVPLPWATSNMARDQYAVFSTYLDQGIITAVFAAVCWHLRDLAPGRNGEALAVLLALLALGNVLFALQGRTGHAVAITLVSLALMWRLPMKYRAVIVVIPFLIGAVLYASSSTVQTRMTQVVNEVRQYSDQTQQSSSGIRLNLWRRASQSIAENPVAGSGAGSWGTQYRRLETQHNPAYVETVRNGNPHQEYLLWGVQLGVPGILIFVFLMLAVVVDSLKMQTPHARAIQSVVAAMAVACLFNCSLYDALIGDFFCVLLGLLLALGRRSALSASSSSTPATPSAPPAPPALSALPA